MIVDAIFVGLAFYFTFPLLTGYCASQYGRSFKTWFIVGCFLPIISFFILMIIIFWNEKTTPRYKLSRREKIASEKLVEELMDSFEEKEEREKQEIRALLKQRS